MVWATFVADAFSGEGARLHGGRWNSRGLPAVYCASSRALAILETLVHTDRTELLQRCYTMIPVEIADEAIEVLTHPPRDWRSSQLACQRIGDHWLRAQRSVAFEVPSLPGYPERNLILNPAHPGWSRAVQIRKPESVELDPRLG